MPRSSIAIFAALLAVPGCDSPDDAYEARLRVSLFAVQATDSVLLSESEDVYLANAVSMAVDDHTGTIYISDDFRNRVLGFSRDGLFAATYGGPGSGPGELRRAGSVFHVDNRYIAIADYGQGQLEVFEKGGGEFARSVRVSGYPGFGDRALVGDTLVYLPLWNGETQTSVARWNIRSDSVEYLVPMLPYYTQSFRGNGRFATFKAGASLSGAGGRFAVGMPAEDRIWLLGEDAQVSDTLRIPYRVRRGNPPAVLQLFDTNDRTPEESVEAGSMLHHMTFLGSGALALVHADHHLEKEPPGAIFTADLYLTLIDFERQRVCIDAKIPNSSVERPVLASRGDTILVLDRRVSDGLGLDTWILFFPIDEQMECEWTPLDALKAAKS